MKLVLFSIRILDLDLDFYSDLDLDLIEIYTVQICVCFKCEMNTTFVLILNPKGIKLYNYLNLLDF